MLLVCLTESGFQIFRPEYRAPPGFRDHIADLESSGRGGTVGLNGRDDDTAAILAMDLQCGQIFWSRALNSESGSRWSH